MVSNRLFFDTLKAHRGWYIVEYSPPITGDPFATLTLSVLDDTVLNRATVAAAMESEVSTWLQQFNVPIMASSFTPAGDLIHLAPDRPTDRLIAWFDQGTGRLEVHWKLVPTEELPVASFDVEQLLEIYADVPYRTSGELRFKARTRQGRLWVVSGAVFVWLVVVPAVVAIIEFNSPAWLAWVVLIFSLSRAYVAALRLWKMWPETPRQVAESEKERLMRHHHYHCERNPEGFRRLVAETIEKEGRDKLRSEAEELKRQVNGDG